MLLSDASQLLAQEETLVLTTFKPESMSVLQIESEDDIDTVLAVMRQHTGPVIIVLPQRGLAFEHPIHFAQLRHLQDAGISGEIIGFVVPEERLSVLARYAHQHGFFFSPSLEKTFQRANSLFNTEEHIKEASVMDDLSLATKTDQPETTETGVVAPQEEHVQQPSLSPPLSETPPPAVHTRTRPRSHGQRLVVVATLVAVLVLVSATILAVLFVGQPPAAMTGKSAPFASAGTVSFTSSGQLDPTSRRGLNDQMTLNLTRLTPPAAGHTYYAWLLPDAANDETKPLLLGTLSVQHAGSAHLNYTSREHTNLLAMFSRFLLTEQESTPTPAIPSQNPRTWRYVGEIPNTPTPGDEQRYSLLAHMRHLLAKDPMLQSIGLNGGLDIWLYRNAGKLVEYTTATRDDWSHPGAADLMHRQVVRILDYLYGEAYVWQKVPAGTPFLIDLKAGRLGLLETSPTQNPPGYLAHVQLHLQGFANSPGHTAEQHTLAIQLDASFSNVMAAMTTISKDAETLVKMSATELQQPAALSLMNDMVANANAAYVGVPDPHTGESTGGITFIHTKLQALATMPISRYTHGNQ